MYDPLPSKMKFICDLFDIDSDGKINREDMRSILITKIKLRNKKKDKDKKGDYLLTPEDFIEVEDELRKVFKEGIKELAFTEFKQILKKHIDINDIIKLFQIIPSPIEEYKIILKAYKEIKPIDTYYVISNQWYRAWKLFINKHIDNNELLKAEKDDSLIRKSLFSIYQRKLVPLERRDTKNFPRVSGNFFSANSFTTETEDSIAKPGKINNSELAGPYPGSLKSGLMVL
jgi:hypothetical protein